MRRGGRRGSSEKRTINPVLGTEEKRTIAQLVEIRQVPGNITRAAAGLYKKTERRKGSVTAAFDWEGGFTSRAGGE